MLATNWPLVPGPATDIDVLPILNLPNDRGAALVPDATFGPLPQAAVRDVQATFATAVDGIVGPTTCFLLVSPESE